MNQGISILYASLLHDTEGLLCTEEGVYMWFQNSAIV